MARTQNKREFRRNDNNLAVAYYRYSSDSQNPASIEQQQERAREYAKAEGLTIVKEYADRAKTGRTANRAQYQLMLAELDKIKPSTLIVWKSDRLARDKTELALRRHELRQKGVAVRPLAEPWVDENDPMSGLIESIFDGLADQYSATLSRNIRRGMDYNAERALYNGHKLFGYGVDRNTKRYIEDPDTAPAVRRIFADYAKGVPMQEIADWLNEQGLRTVRGAKFGVKTLNHTLKNRSYIGEYKHGDIIVPDGMPALVDEATFEAVQRRLALNKRRGAQRKKAAVYADAPRYWLTGHVFCGECGATMQGVSGTSKTGAAHYYYYCAEQRRKRCHKRAIRKEVLEQRVLDVLEGVLDDTQNTASIAVEAAAYCEKHYGDDALLKALEAQRGECEKQMANFVKAIGMGIFNEATQAEMAKIEERIGELNDAIQVERAKQALYADKHSIQAYFNKYAHANLNDPDIRDAVMDFFVERVEVFDDRIVVVGCLYDGGDVSVPIEWQSGDDADFSFGEAVEEFDSFLRFSTVENPPATAGFCV